MEIKAFINDRQVKKIAGKRGEKTVTKGALAALDAALIKVERHHKRKEMRRGGTGPAVPDLLTIRHGTLSKSYGSRKDKRKLIGYYGSDLKYAPVHEFGAVIHAKKADMLHFFIPGVGFRKAQSVTIPARPTVKRTLDKTAKDIEKIFSRDIGRKLDSA